MKLLKKMLIILLCIAALLITVFLIGRYSWKLGGFNACETAGIEQVNVEEGHVRIRGFYSGSFPTGFLGYHAEQVDNTLYVGFKFSALFGIFKLVTLILLFPPKELLRRSWSKVVNTNIGFGRRKTNSSLVKQKQQKTVSMSIWSAVMCIPSAGILKTKVVV